MTTDQLPGKGATPEDAAQAEREAQENRRIEALVNDFVDFNLPPARRADLESGKSFAVRIVDEGRPSEYEITIGQTGRQKDSEITRAVTGGPIFVRDGLYFSYSSPSLVPSLVVRAEVQYDPDQGSQLTSAQMFTWSRDEKPPQDEKVDFARFFLSERGALPPSSQPPLGGQRGPSPLNVLAEEVPSPS